MRDIIQRQPAGQGSDKPLFERVLIRKNRNEGTLLMDEGGSSPFRLPRCEE